MQNFELRLEILKLVMWMDRLDNRAYLDWSVRKVCVCGLLGKNGWHRAEEP